MARRIPLDAPDRPAVDVPAELQACLVEAWARPGQPAEPADAWRRWLDARRGWLQDHDVPRAEWCNVIPLSAPRRGQ